MILGRKSTLYLAYAYQFEPGGDAAFEELADGEKASWKPRRIEAAALLPHLDDYVRKGELLRAFDVHGDLRAAFGARDTWTLTDGKKTIDVCISEPPRLYTFDTRYAFMVLGVTPAPSKDQPDPTLAQLEDTAYYVVRAGASKVKSSPAQMSRWLEANKLEHKDGDELLTLRRWLARLVPGLPAAAPRGTPRTQAPAMLSVVLAPSTIQEDDLHRLRLVHRSDQQVEPGASIIDEDHGAWRCSRQELCMFSSFGFTWVVENHTSSKFLSDAPAMIRDRYIFKWLIVEHQRLCLLALATECADMSKGLDGPHFAEMRLRLLTFIAKYNFRHISNEERHDRFYQRAQAALSIDDLLFEVREEVVEIDTQLAARRAETLNHVLAFLTLVLTPVGLIIGIFQADTLPGKFQLSHLISPGAWLKLITHAPFLVVLTAICLGITVYIRLFGLETVMSLLRTFFRKRAKKQLTQRANEPSRTPITSSGATPIPSTTTTSSSSATTSTNP